MRALPALATALALAVPAPVSAADGAGLVALRLVRANSIITAEDVGPGAPAAADVLTDPREVIGREARTLLAPGRPIRRGDIGPAALVERNQIVTLVYVSSGLSIQAEGRALGRAGYGEQVRVMNLASRSTVTGAVTAAGIVAVGLRHP